MIRDLCELARRACVRSGVDFDNVIMRSDEVIVFGSTAADVAQASSDVDIVCFGRGSDVNCRGVLDLFFIAPSSSEMDAWLSSEIAVHVARYGMWLKGDGDWRTRVGIREVTLERKRSVISGEWRALFKYWERLTLASRSDRLRSIRRNLQRLSLMTAGEPVCPTPMLDKWIPIDTTISAMLRVATSLEVDLDQMSEGLSQICVE